MDKKFNPSKREEEIDQVIKELIRERDHYYFRVQKLEAIREKYYQELQKARKKVLEWKLIAITIFTLSLIQLVVMIFG